MLYAYTSYIYIYIWSQDQASRITVPPNGIVPLNPGTTSYYNILYHTIPYHTIPYYTLPYKYNAPSATTRTPCTMTWSGGG